MPLPAVVVDPLAMLMEPAEVSTPDPSFETVEVLVDFNADELPVSLETEGATAERDSGALAMTFSPEHHQPIVRLKPDQAWDWSDEDEIHIAMGAAQRLRDDIVDDPQAL